MRTEQHLPALRSQLPDPAIMGIINLSHRSFYGFTPNGDDALKKAEQMVCDGASIIDVGAVATNPTIKLETDIPTEQSELDLLIPFVEKLSRRVDVIISVDTFRARVMSAAIDAGAKMINDQKALTEENTLKTAVKLNVPVCLMHHMGSEIKDRGSLINSEVQNQQLLHTIISDLKNHIARCLSAEMKKENIIIDPGFGGGHYGKTADENFYLLQHLNQMVALGFPVLVGLSRKIMFGGQVEDRLPASLAAAVVAIQKGARIIRVHDVAETRHALQSATLL